jgi:predicted AlkP superfamily pyrophosphatase or phosphodiesterase
MNVDTLHTLRRPAAIDTTKFTMTYSPVLVHLYAKDPKEVLPTYAALKQESDEYDVYLKIQVPARWHYGSRDDLFNRIGDILLVPKAPKVFKLTNKSLYIGHHGYDPAFPEMHATFYAWGPAFKQGMQINSFENVHVYPLLAKVLGLNLTESIDGRIEVLQPILR